jgi:hypothetical protein
MYYTSKTFSGALESSLLMAAARRHHSCLSQWGSVSSSPRGQWK